MTDALDRAATAAHDAWTVSTESLTQAPGAQQIWRRITAAALRVMADAIRAEVRADHLPCGECDLAGRVSDILDAYIPYTGSSDD